MFAQEPKPKPAAALAQKIEPVESDSKPKQKTTATHHTAKIAGKTIAYTATVGTLEMKSEEGKKKAEMFFVAYTKRRCQRRKEPSDYVLFQRRAGVIFGLAAHGHARPKARRTER